MSYGALFKSSDGTSLLSSDYPSLVFMGKAAHSGAYDTSWWDGKCFQLATGSDVTFLESANCPVGNSAGTILITRSDGTTLLHDINETTAISSYTVESWGFPTVFSKVATPDTYGIAIMSTTLTSAVGTTYGYPIWKIVVMLSFKGSGTKEEAVSNVSLYCFSEMPSDYSRAGYALELADPSGKVTYHSDWIPLKIRGSISFAGARNRSSYEGTVSKVDPNNVSSKAFETSNMGFIYSKVDYGVTGDFRHLLNVGRVVAIDWDNSEVETNYHIFRKDSSTSDTLELPSGKITSAFIDYTDYD